MTTFLWAFARGDMEPSEFERLLYDSSDLESRIGRTTYLDLLETDFASLRSVSEARQCLRDQIPVIDPQACNCLSWRNDTRFPLGIETSPDWFSATFHAISRRTPWLDHVRCNSCGTDWYVATDTIDDDYYFHRMTPEEVALVGRGSWPLTFDDLAAVWPSQELLELHGFTSLEEWRRKNGTT
jgi:hypothetical protein